MTITKILPSQADRFVALVFICISLVIGSFFIVAPSKVDALAEKGVDCLPGYVLIGTTCVGGSQEEQLSQLRVLIQQLTALLLQLLSQQTGGSTSVSLTASPTTGAAPLTVMFKTGPICNGAYILDDGTGVTYNLSANSQVCARGMEQPIVYTLPGTYVARLIAPRPGSCEKDVPPPGLDCTTKRIVGTATITVTGTTTQTPTIRVTAPNGGEQWEEGVLNTVTWTPYQYNPDINPAKDVTAYLEVNDCNVKVNAGPECFRTIGKVQESGKASIHWITGELNSLTQGGVYAPPGGNYYIRVVNNITGQSDRSDAPFTLVRRPITIMVNGTEDMVAVSDVNQQVTISWVTTPGLSGCQLSGIREVPFSTIQPSNGSVTGHVQYSSYPGNISYGVSLQCVRNVNGVPTQVLANAKFYIASIPQFASLQVLSPNGGETLKLPDNLVVRWKQTGLSSVSIALYKNDQWLEWLVKGMTSDKSPDDMYLFTKNLMTLENTPSLTSSGNVFKIYVTGQKADGSGYLDDKSDAPFSFAPSMKVDVKINQYDSAVPLKVGDDLTLSWSTSNAKVCQLITAGVLPSTQNVALTGSGTSNMTSAFIGSRTYTLRCTDAYGQTAEDSVTATVTAAPTPTPPPTPPAPTYPSPQLSISVSSYPPSLVNPADGTVSWSANYVQEGSCWISGLGSVSSSGSQTIQNTASGTTFTLHCTGLNGSSAQTSAVYSAYWETAQSSTANANLASVLTALESALQSLVEMFR